MKKILLLTMLGCFLSQLVSAQCTPDAIYKDSTFGVYPRPFEPTIFPNGGIKQSACIGKPYKFVFTVKVPDSVAVPQLGGTKLKLDSIKLDKKKTTTVTGLPVGISYDCNTPNCTFASKTMGCTYLYGTATAANTAGDFEIGIRLTAYFSTFLGPLVFELNAKDLAAGKYILKLEPNTSTSCFVSSIKDQHENISFINAMPNPATDFATISFYAQENESLDFVVADMNGRVVYKETRDAQHGINTLDLNTSALSEGVYVYYLSSKRGKITNRLVISK
jgi:hypothetical protein